MGSVTRHPDRERNEMATRGWINSLPFPGVRVGANPLVPTGFSSTKSISYRDSWLSLGNQSIRNTRAGSVRVARQAGQQHAASAVVMIIANADANASGSRGLTP